MYTRNDAANINGTSFYNVVIVSSLEKMIDRFGPPMSGDGYKTKHEWVFEGPTRNDNVAVYDYHYDGAEMGEWNVGAQTYESAIAFVKWYMGM